MQQPSPTYHRKDTVGRHNHVTEQAAHILIRPLELHSKWIHVNVLVLKLSSVITPCQVLSPLAYQNINDSTFFSRLSLDF